MIDLKNTDWVLSADLAELNGKVFSVLDENKLLLDGNIEGTINIKDDIINIDIPNHHFSGHIVEGFIFGDVLHDKQSYSFECNCVNFDSTNVYMSESAKLNIGDNEQEVKAIQDVYNLIKDYRIEHSDGSRISKSRIKKWIDQFEEQDKMIILKELNNIFHKRYLSKKRVFLFYGDVIIKIAKEFGFSDIPLFLKNCQFLDLQEKRKSQGVLLSLLDEYLNEKYKFRISQCASLSRQYSIYLDDVLCTGTTFYNNLTTWFNASFDDNITNITAIKNGITTLRSIYVFVHSQNFKNKSKQISHDYSHNLSFWCITINNIVNINLPLEIIMPLEGIEDKDIKAYKEEVINHVDNYTAKGNYTSCDNFYRNNGIPKNEAFFTNAQNREIIENAFLKKGIEILKSSTPTKKNIRALGFALPSHKNFGFGALCFTWRNIPNNTPLVFWYSGGGFTPLFDVRKSNSSALVDFANFVVQ